jgi:HTH-type transcriptional regulator/antitoxin HigA
MSSSDDTPAKNLLIAPPNPLKNREEFVKVQAVIDGLIDQPELSPDEPDYLDVLGTLVYDYEERVEEPIPDIFGVELLKVLIADRGMKQKDLVPIFKTESIASDILNGKRQLTVEHIQKLAEFFHLSPAVFFSTSHATE